MNQLKKFTALFLAAGVSALAGPLFAQGSGSNPGPSSPAISGERTLPSSSPSVSADSRTGSASTDSSPAGLPGPARNTTIYGPRGAIFDSPVNNSRNNGLFDLLDADHDGRISLAEYARSRPVDSSNSTGQSPAAAATGNSAGNEGAGRRTADFHQLDRDRDGYLSPAELAAGKDDVAGGAQR